LGDERETLERTKTKKERIKNQTQNEDNKNSNKTTTESIKDSLMFSKQLIPDFHFTAKQMLIITENKNEYLFLNGGSKIKIIDLNNRSVCSQFDLPFGCDSISFVSGKIWCFSKKENLIRTFIGSSDNKKTWKRYNF
jgi:hypothetical protein